MDATATFARYEELRPRLPRAVFPASTVQIESLLDIAGQADVFVFDAFGVLNVGDSPIAGACARIDQLRALGKRLFVLTNSASFNAVQTRAKFARLGFSFQEGEIISSRDAGLAALAGFAEVKTWGVIAAPAHEVADIPVEQIVLGDDPQDFDRADGFLFLSTAQWNAARQEILQGSLVRNPRPLIVANPDLVAPRETGLSLEPGYYAHALADATDLVPVFHGKPYPSVFERVEALLPALQDKARIVMMGDTLHTDILGAASRGWRSVLVMDHGLFAGLDVAPFVTASGIRADWQLGSI